MTNGIPIDGVDTHAHVVDRRIPFVSDRHPPATRDATAKEFLGLLDAAGVGYGLLTAPSVYKDNTLILESVALSGGRLKGTANVEPDIDDADLAALQEGGIVGMRYNLIRREAPDLTQAPYRRLLERVAALGWHVEIFIESERLPEIIGPIRDCGADIIFDHFGNPDPQGGEAAMRPILDLVETGRAWVKLSAPYRVRGHDPASLARLLLSVAGPTRLMWGSDWPWTQNDNSMTYLACRGWLDDWITDEKTRQQVLHDTPARLFGFE